MSNNKKAVSYSPFRVNRGICAVTVLLIALVSACATPVGEVERWQISGVEVAAISGEVVDLLCEVSGNCADQCGAGKRQIGIKTDTGTVLVSKDLNLYSGGAEQLWRYCGETLEVNGLFTETGNIRMFQVQNIRKPGEAWQSTSQFLTTWAEQNGTTVSEAKRWYLKDPRITEILERDGRLGLGPEADKEFLGN